MLDPYDDDELHISEHRRFALQMRFKLLRSREPVLARSFDEHIKAHIERRDLTVRNNKPKKETKE